MTLPTAFSLLYSECPSISDANGKLDVKAHIFNTEPGAIPFEQALLNLERSQDQGNLVLPGNARVNASAFERYILKPGQYFSVRTVLN